MSHFFLPCGAEQYAERTGDKAKVKSRAVCNYGAISLGERLDQEFLVLVFNETCSSEEFLPTKKLLEVL